MLTPIDQAMVFNSILTGLIVYGCWRMLQPEPVKKTRRKHSR